MHLTPLAIAGFSCGLIALAIVLRTVWNEPPISDGEGSGLGEPAGPGPGRDTVFVIPAQEITFTQIDQFVEDNWVIVKTDGRSPKTRARLVLWALFTDIGEPVNRNRTQVQEDV